MSEISVNTSTTSSNDSPILLTQLPDILLENIFKFLSYKEVTLLRETSHAFYYICRRLLRIGFKNLRNDIINELHKTNDLIKDFNSIRNFEIILKRAPYYRKYNRLELLLSELNIISAVCRNLIENENVCFPSGILLDTFLATFRKVLEDTHEHWSVMDFTSGDLQMKIKLFLDDFHTKVYPLSKKIPFGVQVVDLMDIMLETDYDITIVYDLDNMFCEYTALYEQRKPKLNILQFLSYTTQFPRLSKDSVSYPELIELMRQLRLIVRIHNELLLRQEQYWREMDVVNLRMIPDEENINEFLQTNILTKDPRSYINRIPIQSERLPGNRIRETYSKSFGTRTRHPRFVCNIELKCLIRNAPLTLQRNFDKLVEKIQHDPDLISLRRSLTSTVSESTTKQDELYRVNADFHMITPNGITDDEIEMFEMYWRE